MSINLQIIMLNNGNSTMIKRSRLWIISTSESLYMRSKIAARATNKLWKKMLTQSKLREAEMVSSNILRNNNAATITYWT